MISLSPEARRQRARNAQAAHSQFLHGAHTQSPRAMTRLRARMGPGTRVWQVAKRTMVGTYQDGFVHAGNLAYLAMLAIFPFFVLSSALFQLIGEPEERRIVIEAVLIAMPPTVSETLEPVARDVIDARDGWLLWFGAAVALWTVSSLIETIRDILRRAYGTHASHAFWKYRLFSAGLILGAVVLLMFSLFAQVVIGAAQQLIEARAPQLTEAVATLRLTRIVPALGLAGSLYMLFYTLTPSEYRHGHFPKWPGALFTALWWLAVTTAMPLILGQFFSYNLTYGSLAGIMVALFFFWLVGLGLVIGAELNAALAEPEVEEPEIPPAAGLVATGAQIGAPGSLAEKGGTPYHPDEETTR
ncbi:MAG: YihY/virulence factor BrkB family protein [Erythrobacter sp.]|nr:YihY/virulence factor BrkB family protein [Erythrobacter sp.]